MTIQVAQNLTNAADLAALVLPQTNMEEDGSAFDAMLSAVLEAAPAAAPALVSDSADPVSSISPAAFQVPAPLPPAPLPNVMASMPAPESVPVEPQPVSVLPAEPVDQPDMSWMDSAAQPLVPFHAPEPVAAPPIEADEDAAMPAAAAVTVSPPAGARVTNPDVATTTELPAADASAPTRDVAAVTILSAPETGSNDRSVPISAPVGDNRPDAPAASEANSAASELEAVRTEPRIAPRPSPSVQNTGGEMPLTAATTGNNSAAALPMAFAVAPAADKNTALRVRAVAAYAEAAALSETPVSDGASKTEGDSASGDSAMETEPPVQLQATAAQVLPKEFDPEETVPQRQPDVLPMNSLDAAPVDVAPIPVPMASTGSQPAAQEATTPPFESQPVAAETPAAPAKISIDRPAAFVAATPAPQRAIPSSDDGSADVREDNDAPSAIDPPFAPAMTPDAVPASILSFPIANPAPAIQPAKTDVPIADNAPSAVSVATLDSSASAAPRIERFPNPSVPNMDLDLASDAADDVQAAAPELVSFAKPQISPPRVAASTNAKATADKSAAQPAPAASNGEPIQSDGVQKTEVSLAKPQETQIPEPHPAAESNPANPLPQSPAPMPQAIMHIAIDTQAAPAIQPQFTASATAEAPVHLELRMLAGLPHLAAGMEALALRIAAKSSDGESKFTIRLDPPELGGIEVKLHVNAEGQAQASLSADRPQTLDLLQRDAGVLERTLKDAGLDLAGGLSFSLKSDGEPGQWRGTPDSSSMKSMQIAAVEGANAAAIVSAASLASDWGSGPRLDITV